MPEKAELTYCILHYNKLDKLKNTIKYIEKYTPIPYQVYIWNNGYINKEIRNYLRKLEDKPEFKIFNSESNLGISFPRNKLLKLADTRYIFFLDDDMYIRDNTIGVALTLFEKDRRVGGITFPQYDILGNLRSNSGIEICITNDIVSINKIKGNEKKLVEVDGIPAGAMLFRRELKRFFSFDPNYKIGFEDLDKTLQIYFSNCPFRQVVSFDSYLIHDQVDYRNNFEYLKVRRNYKELRRSYMYFVRKWNLRLPMVEHILYKHIYAIPVREITMLLNFGIRKLFRIKN